MPGMQFNMKVTGFTVFLIGYFNITFLYLSTFQCSEVHSDSNEDDSTLNVQPTTLVQNYSSSDLFSAEADIISTSEGHLIFNQEEKLDKVIDSTPTNKLDAVPEPVFTSVDSSHVDVTNEIINNDTPIVISRIDAATEELQKRAKLPSPLTTEETISEAIEATEANITNQVLDVEDESRSEINAALETEDKKIPKNTTDTNAEDIPSFSEWAQKRLEEAEKQEQDSLSAVNTTNNITKHILNAKLRWKNYASVDCGAKVILANPEAEHSSALLVGSRDEYVLNPCSSRIWFIVELCEAIQLKKVELANYELFSSSPKDFTVSVGDRFPTRDWSVVGQFTAKDERDVQHFYINTETFGKYVKVEIKSHYGAEHYCPLSLFRAYGTSVFEVLQKDDLTHDQPIDDDDDDESLDVNENTPSNNLLTSATDAVISIVKKAAQVLGNKVAKSNDSSQISNDAKSPSFVTKSCNSPSHYVICTNCSDILFGKIFELLSCNQRQIKNLVSIPFIRNSLERSMICKNFGIDLRDKLALNSLHSGSLCVESFFPPSFLGAMCNILAIGHNKVLYNISYHFANTTEKMHGDGLVNVAKDEQNILPVLEGEEMLEKFSEHFPTEPLNIERPDINTKSGCSTDTTYTSQIKPSRSIVTELPVNSDITTTPVVTKQIEEKPEVSESIQGQGDVVDIDGSTEMPSNGDIQMDGIIDSDSGDKAGVELNTEGSPSVSNMAGADSVQGQKESVFLRLSNRIKALERNVSLSGQYLEELSKRYKKQVEEMQRVLEKTEKTLDEVNAFEDERFRALEDKLDTLTKAMEYFSAEKESWEMISYWLFLVLAATFLVYCYNRISTPKPADKPSVKPVEIQRRNSVDVVTRATTKKKKRRPSDQALKIVASAAAGDQEKSIKKRKKKSSNPLDTYRYENNEEVFAPPCTSSKIWGKQSGADWVEGRGRVIENIPFPLEEADSYILEFLPPVPEVMPFDTPDYVKTAVNVRQGRLSLRNGSGVKNSGENEKKRQSSPTASSVNGNIANGHQPSPKKEKKGFRKLFKKVF
ncbi:SUN domain-containing ossification factor [Euwallacea fornicatus]|uniref:SUN domain-containing ossification factor n=1 Tax=Euwallacea fornicatus TaxID=995702 RepID=UPI00338F9EDB